VLNVEYQSINLLKAEWPWSLTLNISTCCAQVQIVHKIKQTKKDIKDWTKITDMEHKIGPKLGTKWNYQILIDYNPYTQLTRKIMNTHSHVFEITCNCLVCGCTSWVDTWLAVLAEEFLVFTKVCGITSWILARFSASIALPVSTMLRENVWLEVCLPCCPVATWLARKLAFLMGYHMTLQVGCTQAYTTILSVILKANLGIF